LVDESDGRVKRTAAAMKAKQETWTPAQYQKHLANQGRALKHRNQPTVYRGVLYDSKMEAVFAQRLDLLQRAGYIQSWIRQIPFTILHETEERTTVKIHRVDFNVYYADGTYELIEIKGRDLEAGQLKRHIVEERYGVRIVVLTKETIQQWTPKSPVSHTV
jgi:hypothetical protein